MSETKEYTCQECGKRSTDKDLFKILVVIKIGFVTCKECIRDWGE